MFHPVGRNPVVETSMQLPPLSIDAEHEFPILKKWHFFQHSGVSPLPRRTADAIRHYCELQQNDAYLTGKWYKQAETTRQLAARLINADPSEIAFTKNTSEGLAFVSNGIDWKPGDEIISANVEYPANVYPWMDAQSRTHGQVKHVMIRERNGRIYPEDLFAAVTERTRMIALSHVQYASGFRSDLAPIGQFCHDRGILFCVDAIQSCGALPVDVKAMHIDLLAAGGHKWMLGTEGLGIFYCRKDLIPALHPEVGSMNVINATDFGNYDFTLRDDARRFECGGYNIAGALALGASLDLLLSIGIDRVWQRIFALTTMLVEGLRTRGYEIFSPREHESECSGIISFFSRKHPHSAIIAELEKKNVIIVEREKRLRAAPHFYQGTPQIQALIDALPDH